MRSLIPSTWRCFQVWRKLNISSMCHLYRVSFVTDTTPWSSQPPLTLNNPYSSHTTSPEVTQPRLWLCNPSFGHVISPRQQLTTKSSTSTPKLTSSIYSIRCGQVSSSGKNTLFKTKHLNLRHWLLWYKSLADRPFSKRIDSKKGFYRCFQLYPPFVTAPESHNYVIALFWATP